MPWATAEQRRAYMRHWRATHRAALRAYNAAYHAAHLEQRRREQAAYTMRARAARRAAFLEVHGGRCAYCACALTVDTLTIDHIIPRADGGSDAPANLAAACWDCNRDKAARTPEEWDPARFEGSADVTFPRID